MSEFLKFYNLCPIEDPNEFLGVARDCTDGNIIATLNKSNVVVIKISTRKQLYSWTTVEKLSSKVVFDQKSQKYVGIFGFTNFRIWDLTTTNVNSCKKLKFSKPIADLITLPLNTIVLYMDGTFESLEDAIKSRKESRTKNPMEQFLVTISDAKVFALQNGRFILTYFERQNDTGDLFIVRAPIDMGATVKLPLKRNGVDATLSGYAVLDNENQPELLTIWSDNRMFSLSLSEDDISPDKTPGKMRGMTFDASLNVNKQISMHRLEENYAVMYGESINKDGAFLLLYNTQYNVIKARQFFKVFFDSSRIWQSDGHIFLALGRNLATVSYNISTETLADLLGCKVKDPFRSHIDTDLDWIEYKRDIELEEDEERPGIYEEAKQLALQMVRQAHNNKDLILDDVFGDERNRKILKSFDELRQKVNLQPKPKTSKTSEQKNTTSEQENTTSEQENTTSEQENATTEQENATFEQENATSEQENDTSEEENDTFEEENATSEQENATAEQENAKNVTNSKDQEKKESSERKKKNVKVKFSETPKWLKSHEEESQKYRLTYSTANFNVLYNNQEQKFKCEGDSLLQVDLLKSNTGKVVQLLMSKSDDEYLFTPAVQLLITELEKSGCSEHEITEKLLFLLTKVNLKEDIVACLRRYSNISEMVLAKTLKYVLENLVQSAEGTINAASNNADVKVLHLLLTFPFEEDVLSLNLRREIDISLFIYLVEHMFGLLVEPYKDNWVPVSSMTSLQFEVQLLRWLGVLMNSHFQKVALSKDLHLMQLLTQWVELLEIYQLGVGELNDFAALLTDLIESKKVGKEQNCSKWYSIEEIELH